MRPRSMNSRSTAGSPTRPAEDEIEIAGQAGQRRAQLVGHRRDEEAALAFDGAQPGQLAFLGEGVGHERERHRGMPGEGRWQALGEDRGVDGLAEAEPESHLAGGRDRETGEDQVRRRVGSGRSSGGCHGCRGCRECRRRLHVGGAQRDRDRGGSRGRAPRATPGRRRVEPGRQPDRGVAIARSGCGDGDPAGDPVGDHRGPLGPDGPRKQVEQAGQALLGGIGSGEDVQRLGQQGPFLVREAVRSAPGLHASFDEQRRRRYGWCGDRQAHRDTVIHLVPIVPRPVRAGIPPNGDGAPGRRYRRGGQPGRALALRTGRPRVLRTTSMTSSTYLSASPCSAAVRTQPWT